MLRTSSCMLATICLLLSLHFGCASANPDMLAAPAADPPATAAASQPASSAADEAAKAAKEEEDRAAKRRKLQRDITIARRKLDQSRMAMEQSEWISGRAIAKATRDVELARRKFQQFQE